VKALHAMNEQMSCFVKNQNPNPRSLPHELGMHSFGLWCTTCKIWFYQMKKATRKASHFGRMGHHSHHIWSSIMQMVSLMINPTSTPTKHLLEKSKQLHTQRSQSTHKGTWDNFLVIQHDFSSWTTKQYLKGFNISTCKI
jgi:hypothetical protein